MKRSLKHRLIWIMWVLSASVCLTTVLISTYLIVRAIDNDAKYRIRAEQANLAALGLVDLISLNAFHEIVPRLPETLQADRLNEIIRIYAPPGWLLYANLKEHDFDRLWLDRTKMIDQDFYLIQGFRQDYLALLRSHRTLEGKTLWVEIATPRRKTANVLAEVSVPFIIVFVFLLIISFLMAGYLTNWGLKPLANVSEQIDRLNPSSLSTWVPLATADQSIEFREVIQKIDQLLQRTQSTVLRTQRMAQFVAHEIRTPLTILRGEMESAMGAPSISQSEMQNTFQSALEEVERIENTVKIALALGREQRGQHVWNPERIDVRELIVDVLERYLTWTHRFIETSSLGSSPKFVFADPGILRLLLGNIIRNIAEHTPLQTPASLKLEEVESNQLSIVLSDGGPGLPAKILEAANDPSGSNELLGVGLTLCKEIASVGRLGLVFENRSGGGLKVIITLPLAGSVDSRSAT